MAKKKGFIHVFLGFGTLFLILMVVYVLVSIASPATGDRVVQEVGELAGAAGNLAG